MAAKKKAKKKIAAKKPAKKAPARKASAKKAKKSASASRKAAPKKAKPAAKKAAPKAKAPAARKAAAPKKAATASQGRFAWHEIVTPDVAAVAKFYSELFGWTVKEQPMGPGYTYTLFMIGEKQVAGATPPMQGDHTPPHWNIYCSVPDVDKAVETARASGGTIHLGGTDIPTVGRFAVVQDPTGGVLMPFKSATQDPEPTGIPANYTFCWDELLTSDPEAALPFYKKIYGWTSTTTDMPDGKYYVLHRNGQMTGGLMKSPMPMPSAWIAHVAVEDLDASLAKASGLGAKVVVPATPVPGMGRFAYISDPSGAVVALFQGNPPA